MKHARLVYLHVMALLLTASWGWAADDCAASSEQAIGIRVTGLPLEVVATELGVQAKTAIRTDKGVAQYKVTVLTKELPLSQILSGIAEALHIQLKCSTSDDGAAVYEFYEDAESKAKADRLYLHERSGLRRQVDKAADALRLKLSEEDLQKKIESEPLLKPYIGNESFRTAIKVYSQLPAEDRDRLWQLGMLPVPLAGVSDGSRAKVLAMFDANRRQREQSDSVKLDETVDSLLFETKDDPLAGRTLAFHIVGTGAHGITYMFMQSPESGRDLLGNDELFTLRENLETGEYVTEAGLIPEALAVDAKIELPEVTMVEALRQLHEASGINIIADHYTPRYSSKAYVDRWSITRGETIAHEIEKVSEVYQLKWKLAGDACVVWSKSWYEDRRVEIPAATIQRWQAAYEKPLRYELPLLVEMALLSEKQLNAFRSYGISAPESFYPCVRALRFYSSLTYSEIQQAAGESGLPADKLAEDQKLALIHWLVSSMGTDRKPSVFTDASAAGALIRIFQRDSEWVFRVRTSDGQVREDRLTLG